MIGVLGIRHDVSLEVREKLAVIPSRKEKAILELYKCFNEVVLLSTCNRTEIYFNSDLKREENEKAVFAALGWDICYMPQTFYLEEENAYKHIMKVVCGLDSLILGEDQILGQIRDAYETSMEYEVLSCELQRLFQIAITCGKDFRSEARLGEIPVSSASMVVREAAKRGVKNYMLLGFGKVGTLLGKYLIEEDMERLFIAVRNPDSVNIDDPRVRVIPFAERKAHYGEVECIVSCTSSPHIVVSPEDLPSKRFLIFDLAVPRDVHEDVYCMEDVEVYNIDSITNLKDENDEERVKRIKENSHIVDKYIEEFIDWQKTRELSALIEDMREAGDRVYMERYKTFKNKMRTKNPEALAKTLIKSASNFYVNRLIELLKEEHLNGNGNECRRFIERIFEFES